MIREVVTTVAAAGVDVRQKKGHLVGLQMLYGQVADRLGLSVCGSYCRRMDRYFCLMPWFNTMAVSVIE
ncbi:hypothetical protein L6452_25472 [Arctium lappa]|uniref:Uncharacterized protein n=1 Tax=Arctium lappa TaxID=4217 RepID=A0ACB9AB71_ARCLA|nr:hypothetical protein L6452_25472 [Arctium lappa]